ncbi:MAG TPA: PAS domain-containing protein [Kiritimatiellia bacterium]|nr:PAS domain-containing protein [Kiritimatiellia bacterium]
MNLDIRTVFFGYVFSNALCVVVMALLWRHHRGHYDGIGRWLADFFMQFIALGLVALRGQIPDWVSVVLANGLVVGGTMILYTGLERFLGRRSSSLRHYLVLAIFLAAHAWFTWGQPSVHARNINLSLALPVVCGQCAWLMLTRRPGVRPSGAPVVGLVFAAYSLFSLMRLVALAGGLRGSGDFGATLFDTLTILVYQMLFIALTLALFLLVIRRNRDELEAQGKALRESSALVHGLFDNMPSGVAMFSVRGDGATGDDYVVREINAAGLKLEGKRRAEVIGRTLRELRPNIRPGGLRSVLRQVWRTEQPAFLPPTLYEDEQASRWYEAHIFCLPTGELVCIYNDVTERQGAEHQLRENMEEIARMNKVMMNREERVLELKREVNRLLAEAGRPPRFEAA